VRDAEDELPNLIYKRSVELPSEKSKNTRERDQVFLEFALRREKNERDEIETGRKGSDFYKGAT